MSSENGTKIKFCGLRREQDVKAAVDNGADYAGFILSDRFSRYVDPEEVMKFRAIVPDTVKAVGVFVDEPIQYVADCITSGIIDIAQLHGAETEEYITDLRRLTSGNAEITKVFIVSSAEDVIRAQRSTADHILLDSGTGIGKTFDWTILSGIRRDFFLAGGLNPQNVADAIRRVRPWAVDVSSGVETDGAKDDLKMKLFAHNVREADTEEEEVR